MAVKTTKLSEYRLRQIRLAKAKRLGIEVDEDGRVIRAPREDQTALRERMDDELRRGIPSLEAISVMHRHHDPYRIDNPASHRNGHWFREQIDRLLGSTAIVHLRGFHYVLVTAEVVKPHNGEVYRNTEADYQWLQEHCARHARWLGYVDFARIVDERNSPAEVFVEPRSSDPPEVKLVQGLGISLPDDLVPSPDNALPSLSCSRLEPPPQPYRVVFVGEKVSLKPILLPLARHIEGELVLPTGEMSDTLIYDVARRAAEDGRSAVVLYFSDFDPAGYWMPGSVSRKLQALCESHFRGLDIQVRPVALTYRQVVDLNLPSTPLKDGERRAAGWVAHWGREQTEIDALAALQPDVLRQIAEDAIKPFFDPSLETRWRQARHLWSVRASELVRANPGYGDAHAVVADFLAQAEAAADDLKAAARDLETAQAAAADILDPDLPPPYELPQPEITAPAPEPLFRSTDNWRQATEKLIAYRAPVDGKREDAA